MKMVQTLILYRSDLGEAFKDILFNEVEVIHFPFFNTGVVLHEDIIVFIDYSGDTKILKNRFGKC